MNRNDDLSENLNYTVPELPVLTSDEYLSELPTFRELMHWHNDFEFILVTDGTLDFDVNGEILHIRKNQGLFVNSGRLHYGFSEEKKEVLFELVIISPELVRNSFNASAIESLSSKNNSDYLIFHKNMLLWSMLERIHSINKKYGADYQLELQSEMCLLIKELLTLCTASDKTESEDTAVMKQMLNFIQENFSSKLTVSDIAASGMICRNTCFKLFQQVMQMSPQQYLSQYRINKSIEMMRDDRNMSEIAQACGFCSQSHFTKVFKELYGVSPKKYKDNESNFNE